jgi:hypothetical protein
MKVDLKVLLRYVSASILTLVVAFLLGDEVLNRLDRHVYRDRCVDMHVQTMGAEALPLIEMKCHQLFP